MAKYSFEFKKEVVAAYLDGKGGYKTIAKIYGISTESIIKRWVQAYKALGEEGLLRSRRNNVYSFEKKLSVVELYLSSEISYIDLAIQEGISNPSIITTWVQRFRVAGPEALRPRKKGRKKALNHPKTNKTPQGEPSRSIDTSEEYIQQLEDENLKLRIENAFLKELRRLRLEDEAKMRERRTSSTVSEENSN